MNDVIKGLKAEREALRSRLARIETAIAEYERWARSAADLIGVDNAAPVNETSIGQISQQTPIAAFEDEVRALFSRASHPLKRAEVYEELTRAGVVVGGKDPLNTVASRLSRMKGITNVKGRGYWAEDRLYPQAGLRKNESSSGALFDDSGRASPEDGSSGIDGTSDRVEGVNETRRNGDRNAG